MNICVEKAVKAPQQTPRAPQWSGPTFPLSLLCSVHLSFPLYSLMSWNLRQRETMVLINILG
jgi:hypothetical protein